MNKDLRQTYKEKVVPMLMEQFKYKNIQEVPKITKITINRGLGDASKNNKALEVSIREIATITGQQPVVTKAKKTETRGRKTLSKRQKVLNLLSKGESVTWKTLRNKFDLVSPRALVDTLRAEGNMIYVNQTAKGTSYRMGVPTKAIIAAGIKKLYGTPFAYKNA